MGLLIPSAKPPWETAFLLKFGRIFIKPDHLGTVCAEKAADAVGMSKHIPYGQCAAL